MLKRGWRSGVSVCLGGGKSEGGQKVSDMLIKETIISGKTSGELM